MSRLLDRVRQAIREGRYAISRHANEEMDEDSLTVADVESVILTGQIVRRLTDDPRGPRMEIGGSALDGRVAHVVCRFIETELLRIITAYVPEE